LLSILLSGCAACFELAEVTATDEAVVAGTATEAAGLDAFGNALAVGAEEDVLFTEAEEKNLLKNPTILNKEPEYLGRTITKESQLNDELQEIRMMRNPGEPPKLYVNEKPFAEVIEDGKKIRIIANGEVRTLPGRIFSVNSDGVKFRYSPGISNNNLIDNVHLKKGELVIKLLDDNNGWYKVLVDQNHIGYVSASCLIPALAAIITHTDSLRSEGYLDDGIGNFYKGESVNGVREGNGILITDNKSTYKGIFHNGRLFKGEVNEVDMLGDKYQGNYDNYQRSGSGSLITANGSIYWGQFYNGRLFSGQAEEKSFNGDKYDGQFNNAQRDGQGLLTTSNGSTYKGMFVKGKFYSGYADEKDFAGNTYKGNYDNYQRNGNGTFILVSGTQYEGTFYNGKLWNGFSIEKDNRGKFLRHEYRNGRAL